MNAPFGVIHLRATVCVVLLLLSSAALGAQGSPRVTGVEPVTAKIGATVTVLGENLGKANVSSVYLSDSSEDYKVVIVEQTSEKIVVRVPKVKAGDYNVSIQIKNDILIQPVRLSVEE
jgi:hypothetical protein